MKTANDVLQKTKDAIDAVEMSVRTKRGEMEYLRNVLRESREKFDQYLGDSLKNQDDEDTVVLFRKAVNETQEQLALAITCMNDDKKSLLECQKAVFSASKKVHWFGVMLKRRSVLAASSNKENTIRRPTPPRNVAETSSKIEMIEMESLSPHVSKVEEKEESNNMLGIEMICLSPRVSKEEPVLGMTELKSFSVSPIISEQEDETVIVSRTPPPAPSNSPADTMRRRTPDVVVDELRLDEPASALDLMMLASMSPHGDFENHKESSTRQRTTTTTTRKASFNLNFTRGTLDSPIPIRSTQQQPQRRRRRRRQRRTKRKKRVPRQYSKKIETKKVERAYEQDLFVRQDDDDDDDVDVYDLLRSSISKIRRGIFDRTIRKIMSECRVTDSKSHGLLSSDNFANILRQNIPTLRGKHVYDVLDAADTQQDGLIDYSTFLNRILRHRATFTHKSIQRRVRTEMKKKNEPKVETTSELLSKSKTDELIQQTLERLESKIFETPLSKLPQDDEEEEESSSGNITRRKSFRSERRPVSYDWGRTSRNGGFQSPPDN